jgi:hypothetical protein
MPGILFIPVSDIPITAGIPSLTQLLVCTPTMRIAAPRIRLSREMKMVDLRRRNRTLLASAAGISILLAGCGSSQSVTRAGSPVAPAGLPSTVAPGPTPVEAAASVPTLAEINVGAAVQLVVQGEGSFRRVAALIDKCTGVIRPAPLATDSASNRAAVENVLLATTCSRTARFRQKLLPQEEESMLAGR